MSGAHPFCPRCAGALGAATTACPSCTLAFTRVDGLLDLLGEAPREARAAAVEAFYQRSPFPGYAPGDDGPRLVERARRAPFLAALDASLPPDAAVLEVGAGTAQLAAFLALAAPRRRVVAVDGCRASLEVAEAFRARERIENLQLVRADLFDLPLEAGSVPCVISRGVVHHTPDPARAIAEVARRVAPGGFLVLGFYENRARLVHRGRQRLTRLLGKPPSWLDPVLRRRDLDPEKKRIWTQDQYHHPLEQHLALPWVLDVLRGLGFRWVRSVPPAASGASLFDATPEPRGARLFARRAAWALRGIADPDAGLVCVVARRHPSP